MCLAVPGQIVEILADNKALIDYGGTRREANITFVTPEIGDWVIVHAGFAMQIIDEEEARETLKLWDEALSYMEKEGGP
ncbi:MAG: HypC/HybG/HupF family hydrogenase formation chaperone [Thermoplasmatota archaeon]